MITTNFRTASQVITNRQFPKNTGVSVYGSVSGLIGVPEPLTDVRIEVLTDNNTDLYFYETKTNLFGDFNGYFKTPDYDTTLTVKITATYSVSGQAVSVIPIAVGNAVPAPPPAPQTSHSILDYLPIIALTLGGLVLYNFVKK